LFVLFREVAKREKERERGQRKEEKRERESGEKRERAKEKKVR
jgi:hypothetical protein